MDLTQAAETVDTEASLGRIKESLANAMIHGGTSVKDVAKSAGVFGVRIIYAKNLNVLNVFQLFSGN